MLTTPLKATPDCRGLETCKVTIRKPESLLYTVRDYAKAVNGECRRCHVECILRLKNIHDSVQRIVQTDEAVLLELLPAKVQKALSAFNDEVMQCLDGAGSRRIYADVVANDSKNDHKNKAVYFIGNGFKFKVVHEYPFGDNDSYQLFELLETHYVASKAETIINAVDQGREYVFSDGIIYSLLGLSLLANALFAYNTMSKSK